MIKILHKMNIRPYWLFFLGSWLSYILLLIIVRSFKLYEWFPGIAFIGYAIVIVLQLAALNFTQRRCDYILLSVSLIVIGAIASLDMILHKQQMAELWVLWGWFPLTPSHIEGYMQTLIILLNIFTGSVAAQSLFYGLNRRSFEYREE
ncbi:MAG: hypothetical protein ACRBCI_07435 [Cellvibrionaceae bacterium]